MNLNAKRARIIRRRLRFGPTIAKFFALIVLAILAILMLSNSSSNAIQLYEKSDISKNKADLEKEVDDLHFWISRQKTLQSITSSNLVNELEPIANPEYIEGEVAGESTEKAD